MKPPATDLGAQPAAGPLDPLTLRAAVWTLRSVRKARRSLRANGLAAPRISPPRGLPWAARRGVLGVLRRLEPTCLERAVVLQTWLAANDYPVDVIVGVANRAGEMTAHAWLHSEVSPPDAEGFRELYRIPPP